MIPVLKEFNFNASDQHTDGYEPIHRAAWGNFADCVAALVAAGAKVNTRSKVGTTPIHEAAVRGSARVVKRLIQLGADPNGGHNGEVITPVHIAVKQQQLGVVRALMLAGADPTLKAPDGRTAMDDAMSNPELLEALRLKPASQTGAPVQKGGRKKKALEEKAATGKTADEL